VRAPSVPTVSHLGLQVNNKKCGKNAFLQKDLSLKETVKAKERQPGRIMGSAPKPETWCPFQAINASVQVSASSKTADLTAGMIWPA